MTNKFNRCCSKSDYLKIHPNAHSNLACSFCDGTVLPGGSCRMVSAFLLDNSSANLRRERSHLQPGTNLCLLCAMQMLGLALVLMSTPPTKWRINPLSDDTYLHQAAVPPTWKSELAVFYLAQTSHSLRARSRSTVMPVAVHRQKNVSSQRLVPAGCVTQKQLLTSASLLVASCY